MCYSTRVPGWTERAVCRGSGGEDGSLDAMMPEDACGAFRFLLAENRSSLGGAPEIKIQGKRSQGPIVLGHPGGGSRGHKSQGFKV
jgi:hypothetical protein